MIAMIFYYYCYFFTCISIPTNKKGKIYNSLIKSKMAYFFSKRTLEQEKQNLDLKAKSKIMLFVYITNNFSYATPLANFFTRMTRIFLF